jgi:hypothetical protein
VSTSLRASIALTVATGLVGCMDPTDQRPGLRLSGAVASEIPADWSFANQYKEIALEVSTPYLLPHSVTIWCSATLDQLYVAARNPESKRWPRWVARDPNVRLQIGERIYEVKLSVIEDPDQVARARRTYAAKYDLPNPAPLSGPPMRYWRVEPRS